MEKTRGQLNGEQHINYVEGDNWSGINKREYFAGLAMQAMLSNTNGGMTEGGVRTFSPYNVSELALRHADALLEALSKP